MLKQNPHVIFSRASGILCAQITEFIGHWCLENVVKNSYCQKSSNIISSRAGKLEAITSNPNPE